MVRGGVEQRMEQKRMESMDRGDGVRLAFERIEGAEPTLVWLSGFRSDMSGTKAETLAQWARKEGRRFLRLDYSGHGASDGAFEDGTIGRWKDDALAVIDAQTAGPLALVGSSMGGWIAVLIALARPERVKGMLLLAPAPDFTERLIWPSLTEAAKAQILGQGSWDMPSEYDPAPTPITRALIEDGKKHLVLGKPIPFHGPVRILHGSRDPDVPHNLVADLVDALETDDMMFTTLGGGDHRLSRPEDLQRLVETASALAWQLGQQKQD
jgi:pimeloyl-ACP methyl ester carboxylesterase